MTYPIHQTTDDEMAVLRGRTFEPMRYFSVVPPEPLWTGTLAGWTRSANNSVYQIDVQGVSGAAPQAQSGMVVDIGSTAGAHDIARLRVRDISTGTTTRVLPINLTSEGELPFIVGQFVTVRNEYRPFQIDFLLEPIYDVDGTIIGVNEWMDFDNAFGAPHAGVEPKANICWDWDADTGIITLLKPADWEDTPGDGFRTVHLDANASVAMRYGNTITAVLWELEDGTILGGDDEESFTLWATFPTGFRYIALHVYDEDDSESVMRFPLWTHDESYPPFTLFNIPSDITENWREMTLECFGNVGEADETVIPQGATGCYWETAEWLDGDQPHDYIDHALGWITEDTSILSVPNDGLSIKFAGLGWWLDHFRGGSQALNDPHGTPSTWFHLQNLGLKEATGFVLRHYSTAWKIVNVFWTEEVTQTTDRVVIESGSIYEQLNATAQHFSMSGAGFDSFGNCWIERSYQHRSKYNRITVNPLLNADAQDVMDEGIPLTVRRSPNYAQIEAAGSIYQSGEFTLYASVAPGATKSAGNSFAKLPGQYLGSASPQFDLDALSGMHWAFLNNEFMQTDAPMMDNYDTVEPCWERPIALTFEEETVHGRTLTNALFMVRRVTREHNFNFAEQRDQDDGASPAKKITWTVERVTLGAAGNSVPVIQDEGVELPDEELPNENVPPWIRGSVPTLITRLSAEAPRIAQVVSYSLDIGGTSLTCTHVDKSGNLAALGVGRCVWGYSHPHHYQRLRVLTDIGIVGCNDITATTPVWTLLKSGAALGWTSDVGHYVAGSPFVEDYAYCLCGHNGIAVTFDDWATVQTTVAVGGGSPDFGGTYHHEGEFFNSSVQITRTANHLYAVRNEGNYVALYKTTDGGVSWTFVPMTDLSSTWDIDAGRFANNRGQATLSIGYTKPGGAANPDGGSLVLDMIIMIQTYPQGTPLSSYWIRSVDGGDSWTTLYADGGDALPFTYGRPVQTIHIFTHDADYKTLPVYDRFVDDRIRGMVTDDDMATSTIGTEVLGIFNDNDQMMQGVTFNGWVDPPFMIAFSSDPNIHSEARMWLRFNGIDFLSCNNPTDVGWDAVEGNAYVQGELSTIPGMPL